MKFLRVTYVIFSEDTTRQYWFDVNEGEAESRLVEYLLTSHGMLAKLIMRRLIDMSYQTSLHIEHHKKTTMNPFKFVINY